MTRKFSLIAIAMTALLSFGGAIAQEGDLVKGKVTNLNISKGVGMLTIREADTNTRRTFKVTRDTDFTIKRRTPASLAPRLVDGKASDLNVGDSVLLDVKTEVDGTSTLIAYERVPVVVQNDTYVAPATPVEDRVNRDVIVSTETSTYDYSNGAGSNDVDYGYSSLPATATSLPLIALFGGLALAAAGGIRFTRKRMQG